MSICVRMSVPLWGIEIPWLVSESGCCRVSGCCGSYILWNANSRCSLNHAWASPAGEPGRRSYVFGPGWTGRNTDVCIAPALTNTTFRACRPSTRSGHPTKEHLQQAASIMTQLRRQQSHIADSVRMYSTWAASHKRFRQVTAGGTHAGACAASQHLGSLARLSSFCFPRDMSQSGAVGGNNNRCSQCLAPAVSFPSSRSLARSRWCYWPPPRSPTSSCLPHQLPPLDPSTAATLLARS